jgi:hypothetical protein
MPGGKPKSGEGGGLSSWGPTTPEPKSFVRRFRWLIVAGSILVLLLLLVMLAPTLASMGWAKSIVLGQINDQLNGTIEAKEWDLNWFGGIELREVRLLDKKRAQVAEMKLLRTELSVWDVVFGDYYTLGKTRVEGLAVNFKRYNDGTTNFSDLVKKPPGQKKEDANKAPPSFVMPDLKGDFDIDFRGTLEQEDEKGNWQTIYVERSLAKVKVPNINSTLANQLDIEVRTAEGKTGRLVASGSVKLFERFKIDQERFNADESLELQNLPLASALPFLDARQITKLSGIGNSKLQLKMAGVDDFTVEGNTTVDDLAVGGPAMKGDTFSAKKLILEIPKTSFARVNGRIKTGESAASTPIVIRFDENSIVVAVDAPIGALQNVLENKKPGADGQVAATVDVELKPLAAQLPHMLDLPEGVSIEAGHLKQVLNLALSADKAMIKQVLDLTEMRGMRKGQAISAKPVHLTFDATSLGGGGAVPDLRNFVIGLTSGFAQINGTGESLAKHHVDGTVDLAAAQRELGQFSEFFHKAEMAGQVQFKLDTSGDLLPDVARRDQNADMKASLTGRGLKIKNVAPHEIREDWIEASVTGKLLFEQSVLRSVHGAAVSLKTSHPEKPTVDLNAVGDVVLAPFAVPNFEIKQSNIDLPAAHDEFAAFIPESKFTFPSGTIALAARGKMDANGTSLTSLKVNPQNLTIVQDQKTVLNDYTGTLEMVGELRQAGKMIDARLSKLSLSDTKNLLEIEKSGNGDLVFNLQSDGSFTGNGKLAIKNADLKALNDIAQAASGNPPPGRNEPGQLESGKLSGTLELVRAEKAQMVIVGDLNATELTITDPQKKWFHNEKISLSVRASANDKFSLIDLGRLDVQSSFMRVLLSDAVIHRPLDGAPIAPLEMFEKARMTLDVPDLALGYSLVMAFIPESTAPRPTTAQPQAPPRDRNIATERISGPQRQAPPDAAKPAADEPLRIARGAAKGTVVISRVGKALKVEMQDLSGQKLELTRGKGRFGPKDVMLNLALLVQPVAGADPNKPLSEQIQDVQITRLDGNLGIADVRLEEPIALKNLNSTMEASGAIKASGDIEALADFLEVLGFVDPGTLQDYHGSYSLTQKISTKQETVSAAGQINISDLKIGNRNAPQFQERLLAVTNELAIDQKANVITINNLALNMQDSKALEVLIKNGKIEDYDKSRKFDDLKMLLSYDAAKVWAIVRPMLSVEQQKQFKDLRVAGVVKDREFTITGGFPKDPKKDRKGVAQSPLEYTTVKGSLYFDQFEFQGMVAEDLELPLYFNKGILQTIYKDKPDNQFAHPARYSGGSIDLSGLQIDVLADHPRVTAMRKNYKLLDNVEVKREFVDTYLGSASPLFTGAEDARGRISVTVSEIDKLPLDEALMKPKKKDTGRGSVVFSITDLRLKNGMMRLLGSQLNIKVNPDGTISADIHDAKASVEDGKVTSDITLTFGGLNLGNRGTVRLRDEHIEQMVMLIPKELLGAIPGIRDSKLLRDMIEVPVSGSLRSPQLDIAGAALKAVNPANILENILQPKPKAPPGVIGQPSKP